MLIDWNNFVGFKTNLTTYNYGYANSMFYEHLISMDNYMPINMENTYIFIPIIRDDENNIHSNFRIVVFC